MKESTPPIDHIVDAWTDAEREVWNAWSHVEQDVSQPEGAHACGQVLDALEVSAEQVARLQSAVVRGACASLCANPLLPRGASACVEHACEPLLSVSAWQQHLVSAWFGMARQMAIILSGSPSR